MVIFRPGLGVFAAKDFAAGDLVCQALSRRPLYDPPSTALRSDASNKSTVHVVTVTAQSDSVQKKIEDQEEAKQHQARKCLALDLQDTLSRSSSRCLLG